MRPFDLPLCSNSNSIALSPIASSPDVSITFIKVPSPIVMP